MVLMFLKSETISIITFFVLFLEVLSLKVFFFYIIFFLNQFCGYQSACQFILLKRSGENDFKRNDLKLGSTNAPTFRPSSEMTMYSETGVKKCLERL